ncbi:NAD-dependent epimerase/dehydratase family protein [Arthrobacter castelli]|uniref:NAD-dependent epimerase/dehydratase family protein n=1 Tax=Arthrobacter castelli TaxID=271431 RepID=UPI00138ADDE2|nr:NAD-dependent epimerase/dehydratase family protein [Arthrobacter castelli]
MRVLVLGGTSFIGRRVVERLHERGDQLLVVHRGHHEPQPWVPVEHLRTDRHALADHANTIHAFSADAVIDTCALTEGDVAAVVGVLPDVPTVVLSSQDVYQAYTGMNTNQCESAVPITEDSELRRDRYPHRGSGVEGIPDDYEKLDVERLWLERGAVVLRLPTVYGQHDWQRREDAVLRRIRAGREQMPMGAGNLLWTRAHVEDVATGVLAALDVRAADGTAVNLGELQTVPIRQWLAQIVRAAGAELEFVTVPESALHDELVITSAPAQHLLVSMRRAEELLGWDPGSPERRVAESVQWHLAHPPELPWTAMDTAADEAALARA